MTTGRGLTDPTCVLIRMHRSRSGQCWADSLDIPGYTAAGDDPFEVMGLVREFADLTPPMVDHPVTDVRWQWCDNPAAHVVGIRWSGALPEATIPWLCRCESAAPSVRLPALTAGLWTTVVIAAVNAVAGRVS